MGLADLHIHTKYSFDGSESIQAVLKRAKQVGLDVIAITDHNEIQGALEAQGLSSKFGIDVIPGIEISTAEGDLLALFVTQTIERDLSLTETVLKVGELEGICIAPHPLDDSFRRHSLGSYPIMKALRNPEVARVLVAIETYNAGTIEKANNRYARILANHLGISQTGSSDAHTLKAIGLGATEFPGRTSKDLLSALRSGVTIPRKGKEWNAFQIIGNRVAGYYGNKLMRFKEIAQEI
jgi:predicted metal-dependent phosphoesterase TrpH